MMGDEMLDFGFYNMDCMDGMKEFPDKYFDLAIVDPPYGIKADGMTMGSGKHKFAKGKGWDSSIPDKAYFKELFRVSKNQIIWGGELLHRISRTVKTLGRMGQKKSKPVICRRRTCLGEKWKTFTNISVIFGTSRGWWENTPNPKTSCLIQMATNQLCKGWV